MNVWDNIADAIGRAHDDINWSDDGMPLDETLLVRSELRQMEVCARRISQPVPFTLGWRLAMKEYEKMRERVHPMVLELCDLCHKEGANETLPGIVWTEYE